MIKFKNGLIDDRITILTYHVGLRQFAVVKNGDNDYTDVLIDDSYSSSPTDMIHGGKLYTDLILDRTSNDLLDYRKYIGNIQVGDIVKITKGRHYIGQEKQVSSIFDLRKNGMTFTYLGFTDGTKTGIGNVKLVSVND